MKFKDKPRTKHEKESLRRIIFWERKKLMRFVMLVSEFLMFLLKNTIAFEALKNKALLKFFT
jgi:hypothetical protein